MGLLEKTTNHLLPALSAADQALLAGMLEPVSLKQRQELEGPNRKLSHLYFLERGVAAVLSISGHDRVAVGLIGCEGATGMSLFMGDDRSTNSTVMLTPGSALRLSVEDLRQSMDQIETSRLFLRYCLAFSIQAQHTALSNALNSIPLRVARWLLMAHDRLARGTIPMTQEMIAFLLGTRRPAVTAALNELQKEGLVHLERAAITLLDRERLEARVGHFYGVPEQQSARLVGTCWPPAPLRQHAGAED